MATIARGTQAARGVVSTQLLYLDADLGLGCCDDVFMLIWRDRTTVQGVEVLAETFERYAEQRGRRDVALITIIAPGAKMPSPGSREPLARFLQNAGKTVIISGVAFEGDGFMAASIRSVVVGLTLLARQPYPHRVFKSIQEASEWIESEQQQIAKYFSARAIQDCTANFRAQIGSKWAQRSGMHTL